jgi:hypothetical protein
VIAYSATLDVPQDTATLLTELLVAERLRRGTGIGARAASCYEQAVLVLRWFREDTGMPTLACDAGVSVPTGYRYLHEGINVLAAQAPDLHDALEAGTAAGWSHVTVDGTLIRTDRCRTKNPDTGHDLWFSGKHKAHGGNVQIVGDPTGFPVAVSDVQPGSVARPGRRPGHRLPRRAARRGRAAGTADPGRQGLHRCWRRHRHPDQGPAPAPGQRRPQPAHQLPTRSRRTRHRAAEDPLEGAQPNPAVPAADRRNRRGGPRSDYRRTTNPLRKPHWRTP